MHLRFLSASPLRKSEQTWPQAWLLCMVLGMTKFCTPGKLHGAPSCQACGLLLLGCPKVSRCMQTLQGCKLCYHAKVRAEASFSNEAPQRKLEPPNHQTKDQIGKLGQAF